jgi:hypothetical protein
MLDITRTSASGPSDTGRCDGENEATLDRTSTESIVESLIRAARRSAFLELVLEAVVGLALEVPDVFLEIVYLPP